MYVNFVGTRTTKPPGTPMCAIYHTYVLYVRMCIIDRADYTWYKTHGPNNKKKHGPGMNVYL